MKRKKTLPLILYFTLKLRAWTSRPFPACLQTTEKKINDVCYMPIVRPFNFQIIIIERMHFSLGGETGCKKAAGKVEKGTVFLKREQR